MTTNNITYIYMYSICLLYVRWMDFFRDGSMNKSNGWEEKIHGSSSSKLQVPLNFTHTASSWVASFKTIPQYPTKESAENGHCIPNLATPSTPCYRIRKKPAPKELCPFHFFPAKWRGFGSLSNKCAHGTAELLWRRLSRNLADFNQYSPQKRVRHTAKKRENTHKNNYEDIWRHDVMHLNCLEISHGNNQHFQ